MNKRIKKPLKYPLQLSEENNMKLYELSLKFLTINVS